MPDGVLKAGLVAEVLGKLGEDPLVDVVELELLLRAVPDGHHDKGLVAKLLYSSPLDTMGTVL